jgi:actin-related protein 6
VGYVKGEEKAPAPAIKKPVSGGGGLYSKSRPSTAASASASAAGQNGNGNGMTMEEEDEATDDDQVLVMNNERISVPEVLFHPSDIGMKQAGIAETIVASISCCPVALQPLMYANILLVGGNTLMANYPERIAAEVRALAPADYQVSVTASSKYV